MPPQKIYAKMHFFVDKAVRKAHIGVVKSTTRQPRSNQVTQQIFSDRSNANRKAKLMISKGEAVGPFKVEKRGEQEYVIVWGMTERHLAPPAPMTVHSEVLGPEKVKSFLPNSEVERHVLPGGGVRMLGRSELAKDGAAKATERASKRQERQGKAEARKARIQASQATAAPPRPPKAEPPANNELLHLQRGRRGSKYDTAAVPAGTMPPKPVISSPGNPGLQKHVDNLTALAKTGQWDAVAAYPLSQSTTQFYPKILRRYREQLLAAKPT
jgi:hypothetical protein